MKWERVASGLILVAGLIVGISAIRTLYVNSDYGTLLITSVITLTIVCVSAYGIKHGIQWNHRRKL